MEGLLDEAHHGGACGKGFQAAFFSTAANRAVGFQAHVANFASGERGTVVDGAVEDDAPTNAGAQGDKEKRFATSTHAQVGFTQGGHAGVVVDFDAQAQAFFQDLFKGYVVPVQVGGNDNNALGGGDAGDANAYPCEVLGGQVVCFAEVVYEFCDAVGHAVFAIFNTCGATVLGLHFAGGIDECAFDAGATQVDANGVLCACGHRGRSLGVRV